MKGKGMTKRILVLVVLTSLLLIGCAGMERLKDAAPAVAVEIAKESMPDAEPVGTGVSWLELIVALGGAILVHEGRKVARDWSNKPKGN